MTDRASTGQNPSTGTSDKTARHGTSVPSTENQSGGETDDPQHTAIVESDAPTAVSVTEFVEVEETDFILEDNTIKIHGFNNDALTSPYTERARVDEIIEEIAVMGGNSLRVWAFWHGPPEGNTNPERLFQPQPGKYGELAFRRLDYIIEKAKQHGVRLILPFVNNWDSVGSMKDYVRWVYPNHEFPEGRNGRGKLHDKFYTDDKVRELFYQYIEYVVTRENSISGVEYCNDPAILMWELANEPNVSVETQAVLAEWIEQTSKFIKELDSNHLISAGTEGKNDIDVHKPSSIDVYSFHCWPDHWDMTVDAGTSWIKNKTRSAHQELNKPAYLGEYNWPYKNRPKNSVGNELRRRNEVLQKWTTALDDVGCNGCLPYALRGHAYAKVSPGQRPPLARYRGEHADPYAIYHPEDESTIEILKSHF